MVSDEQILALGENRTDLAILRPSPVLQDPKSAIATAAARTGRLLLAVPRGHRLATARTPDPAGSRRRGLRDVVAPGGPRYFIDLSTGCSRPGACSRGSCSGGESGPRDAGARRRGHRRRAGAGQCPGQQHGRYPARPIACPLRPGRSCGSRGARQCNPCLPSVRAARSKPARRDGRLGQRPGKSMRPAIACRPAPRPVAGPCGAASPGSGRHHESFGRPLHRAEGASARRSRPTSGRSRTSSRRAGSPPRHDASQRHEHRGRAVGDLRAGRAMRGEARRTGVQRTFFTLISRRAATRTSRWPTSSRRSPDREVGHGRRAAADQVGRVDDSRACAERARGPPLPCGRGTG